MAETRTKLGSILLKISGKTTLQKKVEAMRQAAEDKKARQAQARKKRST